MLHPLFTEEHEAFRASVRSFVEAELAPHALEWERDGFPDWVFKRMGDLGFLGVRYPPEYGGQGGDWGHAIVVAEEMARSGSGGVEPNPLSGYGGCNRRGSLRPRTWVLSDLSRSVT